MQATLGIGEFTILVVDDDAGVLNLVQDILKAENYNILLAKDGGDALGVASNQEGPIHLLLTDMVMPGMSGHELAGQLKAKRPETRVLYMSGYTEYAIVNKGVMERVTSFIWKPFTSQALLEKVREVLQAPAD